MRVTFAVGLFDLFTYTIPGSLYLGLLSYLAYRLHWVDVGAVGRLPVVLLIVILVVASYLIGYLAYPVGALLNRLVPRLRYRDPRGEFVRRVPPARGRAFVEADRGFLLAAIQLHDKDVAVDVIRLRAAGLMLRNTAPASVLGFVTAFVEIFTGSHPLLAVLCGVAFAASVAALVAQARRFGHWADLKTLELAYWIPDIDERLRPK
jgi:hypothetical protein